MIQFTEALFVCPSIFSFIHQVWEQAMYSTDNKEQASSFRGAVTRPISAGFHILETQLLATESCGSRVRVKVMACLEGN